MLAAAGTGGLNLTSTNNEQSVTSNSVEAQTGSEDDVDHLLEELEFPHAKVSFEEL